MSSKSNASHVPRFSSGRPAGTNLIQSKSLEPVDGPAFMNEEYDNVITPPNPKPNSSSTRPSSDKRYTPFKPSVPSTYVKVLEESPAFADEDPNDLPWIPRTLGQNRGPSAHHNVGTTMLKPFTSLQKRTPSSAKRFSSQYSVQSGNNYESSKSDYEPPGVHNPFTNREQGHGPKKPPTLEERRRTYTIVQDPADEDKPVVNLPPILHLARDLSHIRRPDKIDKWLSSIQAGGAQSTDAWLNKRATYTITGSISAACLTTNDFFVDPYAAKDTSNGVSANKLIRDKCCLDERFSGNVYTHNGKKYESSVLALLKHFVVTKLAPQLRDCVVVLGGDEHFGTIEHPAFKYIGISPDGIALVLDKNNKSIIRAIILLEAKCPWSGIKKKDFPNKYYSQVQLMMEVLGLDTGLLMQMGVPAISTMYDDEKEQTWRLSENDFRKTATIACNKDVYERPTVFAVHLVKRDRAWWKNVWLPCAKDCDRRIRAWFEDMEIDFPPRSVDWLYQFVADNRERAESVYQTICRMPEDEETLPMTDAETVPNFLPVYYRFADYEYWDRTLLPQIFSDQSGGLGV
jgi:hypothetical protein